jgi:hypothetical protein
MVEFQLILMVYMRDGTTTKQMVKASNRESGISKFNYLQDLITKKRRDELKQWTDQNLYVDGIVTSIEGLYAVMAVKVLP